MFGVLAEMKTSIDPHERFRALLDYRRSDPTAAELDFIDAHLDECQTCRDWLCNQGDELVYALVAGEPTPELEQEEVRAGALGLQAFKKWHLEQQQLMVAPEGTEFTSDHVSSSEQSRSSASHESVHPLELSAPSRTGRFDRYLLASMVVFSMAGLFLVTRYSSVRLPTIGGRFFASSTSKLAINPTPETSDVEVYLKVAVSPREPAFGKQLVSTSELIGGGNIFEIPIEVVGATFPGFYIHLRRAVGEIWSFDIRASRDIKDLSQPLTFLEVAHESSDGYLAISKGLQVHVVNQQTGQPLGVRLRFHLIFLLADDGPKLLTTRVFQPPLDRISECVGARPTDTESLGLEVQCMDRRDCLLNNSTLANGAPAPMYRVIQRSKDEPIVKQPVVLCQDARCVTLLNSDGDDLPDACDDDVDGDGIINEKDNCPTLPTQNLANQDGDWFGDACDREPQVPDEEVRLKETNRHLRLCQQGRPTSCNILLGAFERRTVVSSEELATRFEELCRKYQSDGFCSSAGQMLEKGIGVAKDVEGAEEFYRIGCTSNSEAGSTSCKYLEELLK